jgi:hypothetical protein
MAAARLTVNERIQPRHPPPDLQSGARVQSFWEDDIDA